MTQTTGIRLQYWRNGVMMGLVDETTAEEIMADAEGTGWVVYYQKGQQHFSIESKVYER